MRLLLGILIWGWMATAQAESVRVCQNPDGSLAIVVWAPKYIALPADQRPTPDALAGATCEDRDRSTIPTDRTRRDAWRRQADGTIAADPTIETPQERVAKVQASKHAKLKALGLTDDEIMAR